MNRLTILTLLALPTVAALRPAHAQQAAAVALRVRDNPRTITQVVPQMRKPPTSEIPSRVVLGIGGAVAGAYGAAMFGFGDSITGVAVASVFASAIVASVPEFYSSCGQGERTALALAGSIVGALVGGVIGANTYGWSFGHVGGAGLGSGLGASLCTREAAPEDSR